MRESTWLNEPLETEEPVVNVLEEGLLHKIMVFFNIPSRWPGWAVASAGLLLAILSGLVWHYNIEDVLIFNGLDVALMRQAWRHIDLGQGRELVLLGLDCTHHIPTDAARLTRLVEVSRNGVPQVLLYHSLCLLLR